MQILTSGSIELDTAEQVFEVPVGDYNTFSCEYIGDIGSGVITLRRRVVLNSVSDYDFSTPISLATATNGLFNIDITGVGSVLFVITTAAAGKAVTINTIAERF